VRGVIINFEKLETPTTTVMIPFKSSETCNSMPMRPPTRKLSKNFSEEEDSELVSDEEEVERLVPVCKNSLGSNFSNHTRLTASESESEEDYEDRHIRFCMTVKKYMIDSHRTYSEKEFSRCWYSREEKKKRNEDVAKVVARMDRGKPEKRGRAYRGLSCWTKEGTAQLNLQITRTTNAVLDEQDRQWDANVTSEGRIASVCRSATAEVMELALHVAYEDELEAAAIQGSHFGSCVTDDDSTVNGSVSSFSSKKRRGGIKDKNRRRTRRTGRRKDGSFESSSECFEEPAKITKDSTESCKDRVESTKDSSPKVATRKDPLKSPESSTRKEPSKSPKNSARKDPSKSPKNSMESRKVHRDPPGQKRFCL
jgi:hypothetical protein